jgi:hypothetical protein
VVFFRESVARLPHSCRRTVLIRGERGFDVEASDALGERRGWSYGIKRRVTADLASRLWTPAAPGRWRVVDPDAALPLEVAELRCRRGCGGRVRRGVLTRRRDAEHPQGDLWDAAGYNYAAYVTDVGWAPEDVVAFYGKRADLKKAIHELKETSGSTASRRAPSALTPPTWS